MKRANSFALALTTLTTMTLSGFVSAQDTDPQTCADAAFELLGETRYELVSSSQLVTGRDWYKLKLEAEESGTGVVCKIRRGRITALDLDLPESAEAVASTS